MTYRQMYRAKLETIAEGRRLWIARQRVLSTETLEGEI